MSTPRTALLVAITAALWAGLVVGYHDSWVLAAYLVLAAGLVVLSAIDLERFLLPNRILFPLTLAVAMLLVVAAAGDDDWRALGRAVLAGVVAVALFAVLHVISPRGLGFGDVKLVGVLGLSLGWLGWSPLVWGVILSFVAGALVGLLLVATRRLGRRDHLPFGPFLAAGTMATILLQLPR